MLQSLITSKTRIKLLIKFFVNAQNTGYLRGLETEFGESTNSIRIELNRLEEAGLLVSHSEQNRKVFRANTHHPFFTDINSLLLKYVGIDQIVDQVVSRIGDLESAFITGDFAKGHPGNSLDLLLVGTNFNTAYIHSLVEKAEKLVSFKVKTSLVNTAQINDELKQYEDILPVWTK